MIAWMLYAIALSLLITGVARASVQICALYRIPTRWCWTAALVCSIAAPLVARSVPVHVQSNALRLATVTYDMVETVGGGTRDPATQRAVVPAARFTTDDVVAAAWGIASAAFLICLIVASLRMRRARRSWRQAMICGERVLVSADTGPAVIGFLHQEIVLPAWALELKSAELALAIAHEREHVAARDPRLLLAAIVAVAIAPWNPVLWLQLRQLRKSVEGDCDARVLARTRDTHRYASLLIAVGQYRSKAVPGQVLALSYPTSILEWRIRTMTNRPPSHRSARAVVCAAVVAMLTASVVLFPRPGMSQSYQRTATPPAQVAADTGITSVRDSALTATLAATRDTLARLRRNQIHFEPGTVHHVIIRNGRASAGPALVSDSAYPRTNVSVSTVQAAIVSRFPGMAAATPNHKRVFMFIVDNAGHIEQSRTDSTFRTATNKLTFPANPASFSSMQVLNNVPVGNETVSVLWIVRK